MAWDSAYYKIESKINMDDKLRAILSPNHVAFPFKPLHDISLVVSIIVIAFIITITILFKIGFGLPSILMSLRSVVSFIFLVFFLLSVALVIFENYFFEEIIRKNFDIQYDKHMNKIKKWFHKIASDLKKIDSQIRMKEQVVNLYSKFIKNVLMKVALYFLCVSLISFGTCVIT